VLGNGSAPARAIDWFDQATIHDSTVQSAYFYVSGNDTAPNGLFYETEFVFGGQGNGESTFFSQLSASLGLFFGNSTAGAQTAYPTYYSFGGNTGETADNLQVSYLRDGFFSVFAGTPDYAYLGSASATFSLPAEGATVSIPYSASTVTATQSSTTGAARPVSSYLVAAILIVVAVVVVFAFVMLRRGRQAPAPLPPVPMQPAMRYCANCNTPIEPEMSFCPNCGAPQSAYGPASGGAPPGMDAGPSA
jgi:hypothetical protein